MTPASSALMILCLAATAGVTGAAPMPWAGSEGAPRVLESDREACWSEPGDLDGLLGSSEIAGMADLVTEIANDFMFSEDATITLMRWWGGSWAGNGCGDHQISATWNLRIYDDAGCTPGHLLVEYIVGDYAGETFIYCQSGLYPIFVYEAPVTFAAAGGTRYWFSAQAGDHGTVEPQMGRLAAAVVTDCESAFRSAYFGCPDWTPAHEVFGYSYDASQEFECGAVASRPTTWGVIKSLW